MDKDKVLVKILEMIDEQHTKMDGVTLAPELKAKSEGVLEGLYMAESMIVNWGANDNQ